MSIEQAELKSLIDLIASDYHPRDKNDYLEDLAQMLLAEPAHRDVDWPTEAGVWECSDGERCYFLGHNWVCGDSGTRYPHNVEGLTFTGPLLTIIPEPPKEPEKPEGVVSVVEECLRDGHMDSAIRALALSLDNVIAGTKANVAPAPEGE